jgi:hypothetical protein
MPEKPRIPAISGSTSEFPAYGDCGGMPRATESQDSATDRQAANAHPTFLDDDDGALL